MLEAVKSRVGRLVDRDPRASLLVYRLLVRCPWLLPHDRSYLGIRLLEGCFQRAGRLAAKPPASRLILDVGANNGISSRSFLKLLPGWKVVAIEPNSLHAAGLQRLEKQFHGRFEFIIAAAGTASRPPGNSRQTLYTPIWKGVALHTVTSTQRDAALRTAAEVWRLKEAEIRMVETEAPTIALDELVIDPLIIKIDAEGSEGEILKGAQETLKRCRPIVLMEVTAQGAGNAVDLLGGLGFQPLLFDDRNGSLTSRSPTQVENVTGCRNRYFVPRELVEFL